MRMPVLITAGVVTLGLVVAGCGGSSSGGGSSSPGPPAASTAQPAPAPEVSPAGDIPDNQAFVAYSPLSGGFSVKVPEGWARTEAGGAVTFTDKLNAIRIESRSATAAPTVASARADLLPAIAKQVPGYQAGDVTSVSRAAGTAVRITYLAQSPTDPVTGKSGVDAVERYVFFHNGREVALTLSGPKGADNVDPWKIVTDSLTWK